jgi:hypothetical protein
MLLNVTICQQGQSIAGTMHAIPKLPILQHPLAILDN